MGLEPGQHLRLRAGRRTLLPPGLIVSLRVGRPVASMPADAFQYVFVEVLNSACHVGSGGWGHTLNQGHPVGPLSSWTGRPPLSRARKGFKTALPEPCTRGCEDVLAVWGSGFQEEAPRAGAAAPPPPGSRCPGGQPAICRKSLSRSYSGARVSLSAPPVTPVYPHKPSPPHPSGLPLKKTVGSRDSFPPEEKNKTKRVSSV